MSLPPVEGEVTEVLGQFNSTVVVTAQPCFKEVKDLVQNQQVKCLRCFTNVLLHVFEHNIGVTLETTQND